MRDEPGSRGVARPPAILLGADTPIGLAVIRELGRHGVAVHAVARTPRGVGLYSRWTTQRYVRPPGGQDATIALINAIAARHDAKIVLAVSEVDLALLRSAADRGQMPGVRVLVAGARQLAIVADKTETCRIAREVGIPVPMTWQPEPGELPPPIPDGLRFPCVLKWSNPEAASPLLERHGSVLLKSEYCYDARELSEKLARYVPIGAYPLVQAFCPGVGLGHMIFMHEGRALLRFQHRRISEWPPEGGTSTVCESLPLTENAALLAKSEELLRRIGWEGAAMVEYRFDPKTGDSVLMEVNGRFGGSLPLAYHAGAPFAWFTYSVLGLGETPAALPPYRIGLRARYMIPETRRVLALLLRKGKTANRSLVFNPPRELFSYLRDFLRPRTRYYVFSLADPLPFFADLGFVMHKTFRRPRA